MNQKTPETGVTRYYDFNIARAKLSPDGYQRDMIVVNGQYPGPLIEANWGDWIEVTVTNNITNPEEGTAIHWHALLQKDTPYYDGVPGSKFPISPHDNSLADEIAKYLSALSHLARASLTDSVLTTWAPPSTILIILHKSTPASQGLLFSMDRNPRTGTMMLGPCSFQTVSPFEHT